MRKPAETAVPILPVIAERWSPRAFDPERTLSPDEIAPLFEAARWAPSSANNQPWHFVYGFRGEPEFEALHACCSEGNQPWVARASVLMFGVTRIIRPNGKPNFHGGHDLGLAIGMMLLQATSMGYAVHPFGGFDDEKVRDYAGFASEFQAYTGVAVGWPGDPNLLPEADRVKELGPRSRHPVSEFAFHGRWPQG